MREVKRGDTGPLLVSPIVLIGEAYGRADQSWTKYQVCVDFGKANCKMHWPTHVVPGYW